MESRHLAMPNPTAVPITLVQNAHSQWVGDRKSGTGMNEPEHNCTHHQ